MGFSAQRQYPFLLFASLTAFSWVIPSQYGLPDFYTVVSESIRQQPLPQQCFVFSFLSTSVTFIDFHFQGSLPSRIRRLTRYYGFI